MTSMGWSACAENNSELGAPPANLDTNLVMVNFFVQPTVKKPT
jgi:hypothetical protein